MPDIKLADRTHPDYDDNSDLWDLYWDAAKGGENFINDTNLFTHRLEEQTDFQERLDRAYFLNFCETIPLIYNSYIFKENIERPSDENLDQFRSDINGRGLSMSDFIKRAGYFSSVFGVIHALVATPSPPKGKKIISKAEAKSNNIYPRASIIYPTQIKDWSVDSQGELNWIIIESSYYRDQDPTKEREEETHYKIITREKWWIEDEDGAKIKYEDGRETTGDNTLGIVPLITMYHKNIDDDMIGESLLKDIVYINRAILNWCSCIDEQIERQTFSQLVVPDDGTLADKDEQGEDPLHQIGTSSIWTFPGDANHPPNFISPDVANIQTIWKLVIDHIKEIYRISRLIGSSEDMYASRSGRSAQYGFMSVNSALADKSYNYQVFENELSRLAYLQLGKNTEEFKETKYPSSFDVASLNEELDSVIKIMERNFSETLNKTLQKSIARKSTPLATNDIKQAIEKEIEAGTGRVEPLTTNNSDTEKDGDGNPNSQRMSDTFRTNQDKEDDEVKKQSKEE